MPSFLLLNKLSVHQVGLLFVERNSARSAPGLRLTSHHPGFGVSRFQMVGIVVFPQPGRGTGDE